MCCRGLEISELRNIRLCQDYRINHSFIKVPICWRRVIQKTAYAQHSWREFVCRCRIFLHDAIIISFVVTRPFFLCNAIGIFYPLLYQSIYHVLRSVSWNSRSTHFSRDSFQPRVFPLRPLCCLEQTVLISDRGPWIIAEICVLGMRGRVARADKARAKPLHHRSEQRGVFKVYRARGRGGCVYTWANADHQALDFGTHTAGSVWSSRRAMIASSEIGGGRPKGIRAQHRCHRSKVRNIAADEEDVREGQLAVGSR